MSLRAAIGAELDALAAAGVVPFDVHAHTGEDIDGTARTSDEHVAALEAIDARSAIFPLCVRSGYRTENRRVIEEAARRPDRLVPFARLDPRLAGVAAEAEEALGAGARGFKLHPRAEDFRLDHAGVDAILAVAAEARAPVLIHAGAGVGSFGRTLTDLAERHRGAPIVLAHAAVSDLTWLGPLAGEHPNLFFDTAWWNPSDLLALFAVVPPGQVLFGSDEPYMPLPLVLAIAARCAGAAGLSEDAMRAVFGGQLERLLDGEAADDLGPPPGPSATALGPAEARLATLLAATGGCMLGGGDPSRSLELARLALAADGAGPPRLLLGELLEEAATPSREAMGAVAMALTLTLTSQARSAAFAI